MAQFLTIDSSPIPVVRDSARENESDRQGVERRLFSGGLVTTYRVAKRVFECQVGYQTSAALQSFRSAISGPAQPGIPAQVTMSGEWIGGSALTVLAKLGEVSIEMRGEGATATLFYAAKLTLREV